jgi:transposase
MDLKTININSVIEEAESLLAKDKKISPAIKAVIKMQSLVIRLLANKLNITSKNSSKPPSEDKNRKRGSTRKKSNNKPGGQRGHIGIRLKKVSDPDKTKDIRIDRRTLPRGYYKEVGYEARQVFDFNITRMVTEYRAEILEDQKGNRFVAEFPEHVTAEVQYGIGVKSTAVYCSQFQLLPYQRIQDQFADQIKLPLSTGSLFNFNKEAYKLLEGFDGLVKQKLAMDKLLHADETGINVNKKKFWLHCASNENWTYFYPHEKRGTEAIDEIGILPKFNGIMCHDHWKPYYKYKCIHALCNAHHLRELIRAEEQDNQEWAKAMRQLLLGINTEVENAGGILSKERADYFRKRYRRILKKAQAECPEPNRKKGQKGRLKKSKSRNLLERLQEFEEDTLRFMENKIVPFTNNPGENDLRMTKVQQKISGCFRSIDGAYIFCRIRSYLSTCRKNNVSSTDALRLLFEGKMPEFINNIMRN